MLLAYRYGKCVLLVSVGNCVINVNSSAYQAKYCCPCACHEDVQISLNLCTSLWLTDLRVCLDPSENSFIILFCWESKPKLLGSPVRYTANTWTLVIYGYTKNLKSSPLYSQHMNISNIRIYKKIWINSLTQLPIKQLLLKHIFHHISQLHVSAHFYGLIFRLSLYTSKSSVWRWLHRTEPKHVAVKYDGKYLLIIA